MTTSLSQANNKLKSKSRALIASIAFFIILCSLALVLFVTDQLLTLIERFQQLPLSYTILFSFIAFLSTIFVGWIVYQFIFPKSNAKKATAIKTTQASVDENKEILQSRINHVNEKGVMPAAAKIAENNLALLAERTLKETIFIAMFGEINKGKTALISALLPNITLTSHAVGGSTTTVNQYTWDIDEAEIIISDLPGTGQTFQDESTSSLTLQETIQAHLVLYICDGDLNKYQYNELIKILALEKPTIIVVNKIDQYTKDEHHIIIQRLNERFNELTDIQKPESIVSVNSGGFESIIQIDEKGNELSVERPIPTDVSSLKRAIQAVLLNKKNTLSHLRDNAVLNTIAQQLDVAEQQLRHQQAQDCVQQYTRKAVVGALAAVSPGTDVIIQAYLGTSMVKEICGIYHIKVSNFDVNTLLKLVQNQVGRLLPLVLTITGNALKAFPGVGTLAGGIIHAVAYGMVFNALGNSLTKTLSLQPDLKPAETAKAFQEMLSGNMEKSTTNIIKLVLQEKNKRNI